MAFDLGSYAPARWDDDVIPPRETIAEALLCPYPLTVNPHAPIAHERCLRWSARMYGDSAMARRAAEARMSSLVAGFYPTTGVDELAATANYLFWAFSLDDAADETALGRH